jgi:glyoxylase-like metal-dependent hydrolase (beta-lactamase superfamily II)
MTGEPEITFKTSMEFQYGAPQPMSPGVVRVVARNPGPFTFNGTNTYLVGTTGLAVIDPGPDDDEHLRVILETAAGRPITHILVTHAHRDHADGAAALKDATGALTCAMARAGGPPVSPGPSPSGKEFVNWDFVPDRVLADGDAVAGSDWRLEAIHTPGHAPDHLCFALTGRRILFTGDHVMAWNTTVIAPPEGRMSHYMESLERLRDRNDRLYLPAHGGRIEAPGRTVKAYLIHRRWREQAVLEAILEGHETIPALVPVVYQNIQSELTRAAALSVYAHVENLIARGLVACDGPLAFDRRLFPT